MEKSIQNNLQWFRLDNFNSPDGVWNRLADYFPQCCTVRLDSQKSLYLITGCEKMTHKKYETVALVMAIAGVILLWVGMFYAIGSANTLRPGGFIIALSGLCLDVASYPVKLLDA